MELGKARSTPSGRLLVFNEFSNLKAAWHIDRIAKLRAKQDIAPTHVQLIISDLCNQDCGFCAYRMEGGFSTELFADSEGNKNPKRFIPTEKVKEILRDCSEMGVGAIEFTGGGEPTVHPDWEDILDFAQCLGLKTGLVTNGIRLKPSKVLERLTWLRISLDAGNQVTYETVRRSRAWPKAMAALELGARLKGPLVGVGFVVTLENHFEIVDAVSLVKSKGIPYIRLSAMFSQQGSKYYEGIRERIDDQRLMARTFEDENFRVVDFFGDRIKDLDLAAPDYDFCGFQQFVNYIGGDLKVYTCCTNAYTKHGEIGDLSNMRYRDWLKTARRFDFDARQCHHCQFNDKNRVINYMVQEPPHKEFV